MALDALRQRFGIVDAIAVSRPVEAVVNQRIVRALLQAVRRRKTVSDPLRFAASELVGPQGRPRAHRLQGSDARVVLRHRSRDVEIFDEIFVRPRTYDLPAPVAAALRDRASLRVLDLGGNIGLFAIHLLRQLPQAEITSVEPDPFNTLVLERAVAVNNAEHRWQVIAACAAASTGSVRFAAGHYADSKVIDGDDAEGVDIPALDVFPLIERSDLVKIDIEGSEWDILFDERFPTVTPAAFVMEWHAQGCPREDARKAAIDAFQGAGYEVDAPPSRFSHGDLWAWRASPGA